MIGALRYIVALSVLQGTSSGPRTSHQPVTIVETRKPEVAITFDACATRAQSNGFDKAVLDVLERERVPATIFVSGRWVETHPGAMAELTADALIEFGNHTYDHPHMSRLPAAQIAQELDRTEAALGRYGRRSVAFRPPFGDWNDLVMQIVAEHHLPFVTWDVVSGDPSAKTTTSGMIQTVVGKARAGSIIIFHINGRGWKTAEALPTILKDLRARGFRFVQLSELMGRRRHVESGPTQSSHADGG
jgi:peptidoglycan/xylan/chitin deacetylase (PgdA/CDA1 family)